MAGGIDPQGAAVPDHAAAPHSPFVHVLEELSVAALILVGHGALAILSLATGWAVHHALDLFSDPAHPFEIGGVTARYLIEGGELMLLAVVMVMGVVSATVTFLVRILAHVRG